MLPNEIELPTATDFCRGTMSDGFGKHCFLGWKETLFPKLTELQDEKFMDCALEVAGEMGLKKGYNDTYSTMWRGVNRFNDNTDNTKPRLARWFSKTVERFGYDVE
jgi:hypothetical protein